MNRCAHIVIASFFLLPLFITPTLAQYDDLEFEHITVAEGLPDNSVWRTFQDHKGFMWFGTANGLVKYDGYKMTVYQPDKSDSTSILDADVNCIIEDRNYNLWIAHTKGISLFHRESETFTNYLYDPKAKTFLKNWVFNIYQDHFENIWVGTYDNGLFKMVVDSSSNDKLHYKVYKHFLHDPEDSTSIPSNSIFDIYEDKDGKLLFGGPKGISFYNKSADNFVTHNVISDSTSSVGWNTVTQIFKDNLDNL